jgi:hypothetical protein
MIIEKDEHRAHFWVPDCDGGGGGSLRGGGGGGGGRGWGRTLQSTPSEHAKRRLLALARQRVRKSPPPHGVEAVRFPAGILFARDRNAGAGAEIRDELVSSFTFWNKDSGNHFDLFVPGWYFQQKQLRFNNSRFLEYRSEIERESEWKYSGETDLLLLNFDYDVQARDGRFAFDEVMVLPVEALIRDKRIGSLPALLSRLHDAARGSRGNSTRSAVWEISDNLGFEKGWQAFWKATRNFFLRDFANIYDDLKPFGLRDLRREK